MVTHFRSIRLRNNAGMDFPQCFANAKLLNTELSRLPSTNDESQVTCKRCKQYLGHYWTLDRVRLNQGGYTVKGQYFGVGKPLYWFCSNRDEDGRQGYVRAWDRADAKAQITAQYPDAVFSR